MDGHSNGGATANSIPKSCGIPACAFARIKLVLRREQRCGHRVSGKSSYLEPVRKGQFSFEDVYRHVQFRQGNVGIAFFREGCAGMEKHERNRVRACRPETRPEQRYTIAVSALHWLYFFSSDFGGEDGSSGRKFDFQKRLRLSLHGELYFGEGLPFRSDKGRDGGAFSDGGEHAGVREARPFQCQRGRFRRLAVIAKRRLQRITGKSAQVRIHVLDVQAV